ncbi:hypothetical protein OPKNFCMD_5248 [Methylobacterium crusticola]|uniref:Uncharacterized protein n=1 Tax=Methylobacterium crusticola TaxID=1697972 RepID=A0ABQ4R498_9HYPH|nr:hypothetical protein [Methylobacterium crusticola]GJD52482.1 hypothetical protein OPKNFCMD_5248 [Methylobacterium crusticola]
MGLVRVELHPPGVTLQHRGPAPLASAMVTVPSTGQSDPNVLPTPASINPAGFTGSCVAFVTVLVDECRPVYAATGKTPNAAVEPRHLISLGGGGAPTTVIDVGANDRITFASPAS